MKQDQANNATRTYTITEIGQMLGISHQRVTQIEQNALRKLRNALKLLGYDHFRDL